MKIEFCELVNGSHRVMDADEDAPLLTVQFHNEVNYNLSSEQKLQVLLIAWEAAAKLMLWFKAAREGEDCAKSQFTQCQERLAVAEGLLTELERLTRLMSMAGMSWDRNDLNKLHTWIQDFLSHTPGEYVAVRREDLQEIIHITERKAKLYFMGTKAIDRLKAALESKT